MRIGDYRIERELGVEETSVVYLGVHTVLPRQAAVKVLHALPLEVAAAVATGAADQGVLLSESERAVALRVLREACLLEALSHPGIPRVFECGILPDRRPWAAFERIDGVTLASLMAGGPMAIADVVPILRDVGDLLAHAHGRGAAHRRLTADAIVRTPDRGCSVCVRDWGDARMPDREAQLLEDAWDDVRALGAVVFHALTGRAPDAEVSTAERCPGAPAELAALVDQMLAAEPAERPPSDEVRDRARWLADTFEPRMSDRLRWAPPVGLTRESIPRSGPGDAAGFTGRPRRPRP
jgi:serine/threonine protein kinase